MHADMHKKGRSGAARRLADARELRAERSQHGVLRRAAVALELVSNLERAGVEHAAGKLDELLHAADIYRVTWQLQDRVEQHQ